MHLLKHCDRYKKNYLQEEVKYKPDTNSKSETGRHSEKQQRTIITNIQ